MSYCPAQHYPCLHEAVAVLAVLQQGLGALAPEEEEDPGGLGPLDLRAWRVAQAPVAVHHPRSDWGWGWGWVAPLLLVQRAAAQAGWTRAAAAQLAQSQGRRAAPLEHPGRASPAALGWQRAVASCQRQERLGHSSPAALGWQRAGVVWRQCPGLG